MDRVGLLVSRLQQLVEQHAAPEAMLQVTQSLQAELMQLRTPAFTVDKKKVAVRMPSFQAVMDIVVDDPVIEHEPLPIEEPLVIERIAEPALKESTEGATLKERINMLEEVPTLSHQPLALKELNEVIGKEAPSLNDHLKEDKGELSEKLQGSPIRDLRKAIGINDRYRFIMELFRGDEAMFERSLKTINHFSIFAEAQYWIQRELKLKLGWHEDQPAVTLFDQLVRRRFS